MVSAQTFTYKHTYTTHPKGNADKRFFFCFLFFSFSCLLAYSQHSPGTRFVIIIIIFFELTFFSFYLFYFCKFLLLCEWLAPECISMHFYTSILSAWIQWNRFFSSFCSNKFLSALHSSRPLLLFSLRFFSVFKNKNWLSFPARFQLDLIFVL